MSSDTRSAALLCLGALTGVLIAAAGIVEEGIATDSLPPAAVARVGEDLILKADYDRAIEAMTADRRAMDAAARERVLERLIDEAILVRRGLELGLAEREPRVRALLSASVLDLLVAQAEAADDEPSEATLRAFYEDHRDHFRRAPRAEVRRIIFSERLSGGLPAALERAKAASERLREGVNFEVVSRSGDPQPTPLPATLLPASKLSNHLGQTLTAAVFRLNEGETSGPLLGVGAYHLLTVAAFEKGSHLTFEESAAQVRAERRRRVGEAGVGRFLKARREAMNIVVAKERL